MLDAHAFLKALATVLCVAAVTTIVFHRLRLPVVLGYVIAGIVVGPYLPIPLVADHRIVQTLSELGVILLMFSLGLEFSLRKLVRVGPTAGLVTVIEVSVMLWLGYLSGRLLGMTTIESIFTGAIVSISSTMIIAKTFAEHRPEKRHAELVFGILVFEDLVAILLLATLTALSTGSVSLGTIAHNAGRLILFLLALLAVGILVVPRVVRYVVRVGNDEMLLVGCIGLCFAAALLAQAFGYSVALGAFVGGSLVAESGQGKRIEPLIHPVRDLFGAVFFVSVGMMIDPRVIPLYYREGLLLTGVVVVGKILGVSLGAFLTGNSIRASIQAAMTLAQIGEFSFIIAGLGLSQGATRSFLYPVAVLVSVVTALLTPLFMRLSLPLASYVDRRLPRPLQTFFAIYASWVEGLRTRNDVQRSEARRIIRYILLDAFALALIAIGTAVFESRALALLAAFGTLTPLVSSVVLTVAALIFSVPFWVGLVRSSGRLAELFATRVIPASPRGQTDLGLAPRKALQLSIQLLIVLLVGTPLLAITQPFLPALPRALAAVLLVALVLILGVSFFRSAKNLLGHVKAGAHAVIEVLAAQSAATPEEDSHDEASQPGTESVDNLKKVLTGLGSYATVRLDEKSPSLGKTLAQLNLRGHTGATVLAIQRGGQGVATPGAQDLLQTGDVLVLVGSAEALRQAQRVLEESGPAASRHAVEDPDYEFFGLSHEKAHGHAPH